ncbi:GNAT family N-acetyltransferase [Chitinimonas sp. JJ19]|uniref:GNAT family N-acetyltransferase n=1 Tax=Chitinimonas sp. JJ19 TaxID=3109352 RepID=UPI0030027B2C
MRIAMAKGLSLRDWQQQDVPLWRGWMQPGHAWKRLDGPYYPLPDAAALAASEARLVQRIAMGTWPPVREGMVIADADDQFIGEVSRYWQSEESHWLSVGLVLYDPAHWGQGLGQIALQGWCSYLFAAMPVLARLDLRTWSGNEGMMRLATKVGFVEEARFRRARVVDGQYYDGMAYGVLREEWMQRYPDGGAMAQTDRAVAA